MGGFLASSYPFLVATGCVTEKNRRSFVYVLAMCMAIQTTLFLYASGRLTDSVMDSDDSLSYTVSIVGLAVILQNTR